jgi:magnesium-transporting ATPase (P-type)
MGQCGTDVAKETADLIITDDRFASVVAGIVEGRVAYNNVRKVVYLLTATGAAEILLFALAIIFNTPLPLTAAQTLWLNLVTNGIQDVGLAFEPGEGSELTSPPRKPNESIFDRLMLERIILSALVMGLVSYFYFFSLINWGVSESSARNLTLLLMVLFENIMIGNCRSETRSAFKVSPFKNPMLLFGTLAAQAIHIGALYHPTLQNLLGVEPVSLMAWAKLLALALSVFVVMEVYKWSRQGKLSYSSK